MTMHADLFLTADSVIEVRQLADCVTLNFRPAEGAGNELTLFVGAIGARPDWSVAVAQLDKLAAAVMAAAMMIRPDDGGLFAGCTCGPIANAHCPVHGTDGPDDPTDDPTDDPCRACDADAAGIGTFDHGIPHTMTGACKLPTVDGCNRTGNHAFHTPTYGAPVPDDMTGFDAWPIKDDPERSAERDADILDQLSQVGISFHPVRQAHPLTENESRALWGDR